MEPLKIGDRVIYTNPQGVCFGERTIIGIESWYSDDIRYFLSDSDSPWFSVEDSCVKKIK